MQEENHLYRRGKHLKAGCYLNRLIVFWLLLQVCYDTDCFLTTEVNHFWPLFYYLQKCLGSPVISFLWLIPRQCHLDILQFKFVPTDNKSSYELQIP